MEYIDVLKLAGRVFDCADHDDLRGMSLSNRLIINHEGRDFTGALLYKCYPSGFSGALEIAPCEDEKGAPLVGANLEDADLRNANLECANLGRARLPNANLRGADLRNANLQGANLFNADLDGAYLDDANLTGASLTGANLEGANLRGANLYKASLQWANLQGANLQGANLERADLGDANLQGANLQGAKYNEGTKFEGSKITQEQFTYMERVDDEYDEDQRVNPGPNVMYHGSPNRFSEFNELTLDNARSNPEVRTELGVVDYEVYPIRKYNDLQKKKALGESIWLDYERCFERLDGLEELLSRVDYVAKVYLVEKVDGTPPGTGELLYKSIFEDIAKQYEDKAVLIVSASCDKMFDSTNYPAWSSAYRAAESSPYVIRYEFILEDYYICSKCDEVYTHAEMPNSEECCGEWLGEYPSSSQGYYYILIGDPLSEDQRANPEAL